MLFLDTTVLVGAADRRDQLHDASRRILQAVATGRLGTALVSDFILDETVTILGRRRGVGAKRAVQVALGVLDSGRVRCAFIDATTFRDALQVFAKFEATLSLTDASTVAVMRSAGCSVLFSHDADFDRVPGISRQTAPG